MIHLSSIALRAPAAAGRSAVGQAPAFPFDVPAIRTLPELRFDRPVTMFVGENGSGKSTLIEAVAIAAGLPTAGAREAADDDTLAGPRALADALRLGWTSRTHRGLFLRAEDFFGFARRTASIRAGLVVDLARVDAEYAGRPGLARDLARTPYLHELDALDRRYGEGLDTQSHGEAFLRFFEARLVPRGLYLLDEPEAPLSPQRQLAFLAQLRRMVETDCQVIAATHSPIVLAFPGAAIWDFDQAPIARASWDSLEHVKLVRDFLTAPEAFLRHL